MNTITKEEAATLEATGASGITAAFRLTPFDAATITMTVATTADPPGPGQPGAPDLQLEATNETTPDPVAPDPDTRTWIALGAPKALTDVFEVGLDTRYYQYRISHSNGDADDALSYHLFRWRLR